MNIKQSNLSVNKNLLRFLIECRSDSLGKLAYYVTINKFRIAFRSMDSVLDFLEMNKSLGYVE